MRRRLDLFGEMVDLKPPAGEDVKALKAFWEQVQEREKMAAEIADDIFPLDFHIYEIKCPENCRMQIGVENVWQVIDGSFSSGDKKTMKELKKLFMGNKFLALRKSEVAKAAPDRAALMGKVSRETSGSKESGMEKVLSMLNSMFGISKEA